MKLDFTLTMEQQTLVETNLSVIDKAINLFINPWGCITRYKIIANGLYRLEQSSAGAASPWPVRNMMTCPMGQEGWQRDSLVAPPTQRERCRDICF